MIRLIAESTCEGGFTRPYVEMWAALIDGTFPPGSPPLPESSPIGKCGICGARFVTKVSEQPDADPTGGS